MDPLTPMGAQVHNRPCGRRSETLGSAAVREADPEYILRRPVRHVGRQIVTKLCSAKIFPRAASRWPMVIT